jgi:uncharacterized protein involved in outer membrane biogenesis
MARILKRTFWFTILITIVLGSVPFWAPPLINWNSQRERLEGLLKDASGVTVKIRGDIKIESLVPRARVSVGGSRPFQRSEKR